MDAPRLHTRQFVAAVLALCILGGVAGLLSFVLRPADYTSYALVLVPPATGDPDRYIADQVAIATGNQVIQLAAQETGASVADIRGGLVVSQVRLTDVIRFEVTTSSREESLKWVAAAQEAFLKTDVVILPETSLPAILLRPATEQGRAGLTLVKSGLVGIASGAALSVLVVLAATQIARLRSAAPKHASAAASRLNADPGERSPVRTSAVSGWPDGHAGFHTTSGSVGQEAERAAGPAVDRGETAKLEATTAVSAEGRIGEREPSRTSAEDDGSTAGTGPSKGHKWPSGPVVEGGAVREDIRSETGEGTAGTKASMKTGNVSTARADGDGTTLPPRLVAAEPSMRAAPTGKADATESSDTEAPAAANGSPSHS